MEELYVSLTQYEKKHKFSTRFGSLYRLYLSKLWSTLIRDKKTWIFNALVLLPIVAGPIIALAARYIDTGEYFELYSDIMFLGYFGIIIPLFTMYIASMMFNDEIGDRSITYLTSRPINRFELVLVKYISYLSIVPIFTVIATGLNYLSFSIFGGFEYFDMALWFLLITFVASAVYGAFFMFIGLLFKNPLWFGLFFVFIWEFVFASFSTTLNKLTIAYYIKSMIVADPYSDPGRGSPAIIGQNQAFQFWFYNNPAKVASFSIVLLVIVVISITLAWALIQGDRAKIPYQAGRRPGGWKYYLKEIRSFLITIGILFITLGLVVGPVNGVRKPARSLSFLSFEVDDDIGWYNEFNPSMPSLADMGYGGFMSYTVTQGDVVNISYTMSTYHPVYMAMGFVCTEEAWDIFYEDTQLLWFDFAELYAVQYFNTTLYAEFISDYSLLANSFISNTTEWVFYNEYTPATINLVATEKEDIHIGSIITYFDLGTPYIRGDMTIDVDGEIFRRSGYSFGWVMFGLGLVTSGFAIYSLITYSSKDEIKRYEEQITQYNNMETGSVQQIETQTEE
ncbi:MAG: ABC transporter permease [Candidatus Heimdallarchaeota archaeon]|nr:ABC transporter permease [Candidatus Heimdallarchaeota archaeon]MBY8993065.1 ABC transporter permease [Candidatus Heimdallarchaeota archaeon]